MNNEDKSLLGCGFGTIIGVILLVIVLGGGGWLFKVYFAEEIGRGNAEIQLESAPYRIQAYDHFFDLCASVQTSEISIDAQTQLLETTTSASAKDRINTNIGALHARRGSDINQYNADASKDYTQAQFRDSKLPYRLETTQYKVGGPKTECAY